ncbi:hypothetical protein [Kineobactrum salinum]|uniref:Uncharacterized protein n=1 Tax=Kineobactrum salinum TaxID=2708301 RepID=A0A6C0U1Y9_9GAMM|nr:hypothetical protein [Kineobactrum salinum]QIB66036.1 hypothetical protein G3T16_12025 [Kineobactrum salinum]
MNCLRLLGLLLIVAAASVPAQEEGAASQPPADEAADEQQEAAPLPAEKDSGSPFDYEASEQISEDLSVSFPVDI